MKIRKKFCAWISDHPPTFEQEEELDRLGYIIVQIRSPRPGRWDNAKNLFRTMMKHCTPDIIVMVLPSMGLGSDLLERVGKIPVYQANMEYDKGRWNWKGTWSRITGTKYIKSNENIPSIYEVET